MARNSNIQKSDISGREQAEMGAGRRGTRGGGHGRLEGLVDGSDSEGLKIKHQQGQRSDCQSDQTTNYRLQESKLYSNEAVNVFRLQLFFSGSRDQRTRCLRSKIKDHSANLGEGVARVGAEGAVGVLRVHLQPLKAAITAMCHIFINFIFEN